MPAAAKSRVRREGCSMAITDTPWPKKKGYPTGPERIQKVVIKDDPHFKGVRLYPGDSGRFSRLVSFVEATHSAASTVTAVLSLSGATTQGFLLYSIHPALHWTLSMAEVGVIATASTSVLTIIRECSGDGLPVVWEACMRVGTVLSPWASLASSALLIVTTSSTWAPFYATVLAFNTGGFALAEWTRALLRKSSEGLTRTLGTAGAWFGALIGAASSVVLSVSLASGTGPLSLVLYSGLCQLGWGQPTIGLAFTGGMSAAGALCGGALGAVAGQLHHVNHSSSAARARHFWFDWLGCGEHCVEDDEPGSERPTYDPEAPVLKRVGDVLVEIGWL
ncbi:hypothetical protein FOZ63_019534 [Perkinsus olseni]|uniref:Uncharacterized protein n=1 Tax=Perkinsus olseni TaxID=32597 RepID=A0A7J6UJP0_PEROL|nr:hypothetical protein FOZ62_022617 [Perkinsus olseni]KAF4757228.1 hypothetical protein FOZ63_019534 [Perkinsus olseni]